MTTPPARPGGGRKPVRIVLPTPRRRNRLVGRLWAASERQVAEIEARLAALTGDPAVLERDAKTLATIARTLRELLVLDPETRPVPAASGAGEDADAGTAVRSLTAFRAELAARLDALRGEGPGTDPAGTPES